MLLPACGAVLMLTQYIAVREMGAAVFPSELITILSVISILSGHSLAYRLAPRLTTVGLTWWGGITFIYLLTLPISIRLITSFLIAQGVELGALLIILLGSTLFTSTFFALFLPRLTGDQPASFPRRYALELAGALLALLPAGLGLSWHLLLSVWFGLIVLVIHLGLGRPWLTRIAGSTALAMWLAWPHLDAWTTAFYCRHALGMERPRALASAYSPYQRIDIVQEGTDRALLLDGILFYAEGMLHRFNSYIAEVPGRLLAQRRKALVIGAGSLHATAYLVRQGFAVVTIDLDPVVAELGMRWFKEWHGLQPGDFELRIGDARRWLALRPDERFDLIVLDIPAAYHLQTALLYTPESLAMARDRLEPTGLLALNTTANDLTDPTGLSIISGACQVFPALIGVKGESVGLIFLYGGYQLPVTPEGLRTLLKQEEPGDIEIYPDATLRQATRQVAPHRTDRLVALLTTLQSRIPGRNP